MKSNELRIGNWIREFNFGDMEAELIDIEYISQGDTLYHPIPLTEEWLLKLGFEKHGNKYGKNELYFDMAHSENNVIWKFTHTYPRQIQIYFVHQLQNLYFALTSEELVLKD